ncbi:MAG: glucosyl-3-phosphoglycerate synthase [Verrucomicrobia bacterium]|nr:glucosyl-3-phosphoglycerate synthase [Verrucomicrobiota bacterium]
MNAPPSSPLPGLSPGAAGLFDPARVQAWLRNNTFHHSRFADLKRLVDLKQKQGVRISLCLPTLNEERTIGKEIVLLKSELMTRHALLDEIAVIDSGSTDRTREVAASFGADVHLASDILPSAGARKGKGENLWKALYQLSGDLIVYIDADIANVRPYFAYGLLGPLLEKPEVHYVKAFYDRPLQMGKGARMPGGGRVTEMLVRPLFSLFYPELASFIQPLSGEYAARRETLEQLSFPIGYGVETTHLIDIYHRAGLAAFAQVDLDQRVHRNQSVASLGRMSFGILQVFFDRLKRHGCVDRLPEMATLMRQFQTQGDAYEQLEHRIVEDERPAIATLPEYREKFGRRPDPAIAP